MEKKLMKGKLFDYLGMNCTDEIPKSLIKNDGSTVMIGYGPVIAKLDNSNPLMSTISPWNPKNLLKLTEDNFHKLPYDLNNQVHIVDDRRKDYPLPAEIIRYVMKYFRQIYEEHGCEAGLYLMLNPETKEWRPFFVPQVDCSHGSVHYLLPKENSNELTGDQKRWYDAVFQDPELNALNNKCLKQYDDWTNEGFKVMGTIHSHCNFGAFHSGIDDDDEVNFPGLHITLGNVDKNGRFSWAAKYVDNTAAWTGVPMEDVIGVKDFEPLLEGLDDIVINDDHLNLMRPKLGKFSYYTGSSGGYAGQSYGGANKQKWFHYGRHWSPDSDYDYNPVNNSYGNHKIDWLYKDSVFDKDHVIRLLRKGDNKVILVKMAYYYQNRDKFSSQMFVELQPSDIPDIKQIDDKKFNKHKNKKNPKLL